MRPCRLFCIIAAPYFHFTTGMRDLTWVLGAYFSLQRRTQVSLPHLPRYQGRTKNITTSHRVFQATTPIPPLELQNLLRTCRRSNPTSTRRYLAESFQCTKPTTPKTISSHATTLLAATRPTLAGTTSSVTTSELTLHMLPSSGVRLRVARGVR
jgi:hypothetical protein